MRGDDVSRVLDSLSQMQVLDRTLLLLHYGVVAGDALTTEQLAQEFGVSPDTMHRRINQALAAVGRGTRSAS